MYNFMRHNVKAILVISVILCIAAFGCMIAAFVIAGNAEYDGYENGFYYDVYEDEGAEYIQLTHCDLTGNIEIPEEIDGKPVRGMSSSWRSWGVVNPFFTDPEGVLSVIFPAALQEIGDGAFAGCRNLRALTFPQALQEVGRNAFENCTALQAITLPAGVTSVGENAFRGCTNLRSVALPDSVTSIGMSVFGGCTSLQEVTMPIFLVEFYQNRSWVNIIFEDFFESSDEYTTITDGMTIHIVGAESIPDSYSWSDEQGYFENCMASAINITGALEKIGSTAFLGCTRLEQVTLPSTVTEIESSAFSGCTNVRSIVIPLSVTEIWSDAFENCPQLTIYAEAASKPEDWVEEYFLGSYLDWNSGDCPVVWGYRG